jgi:uncharacterized membrane protein YkvA (DUF1232 family)
MNPLMIVLCVLYILSPIDFLPDVIPIAGWVDDLGVIGYLVSQLSGKKDGNA